MKITKPLDNILNSEAKVKILRFLCMTGAQWNGRQIAREVGVTPATAHKALNSLNEEGVLLLRNVGKTYIYSLSDNNFLVNSLLKPLFAKESKVRGNIITIIKKKVHLSDIEKHIVSIALFGSVNVKKDHVMSDIDIVIIVENAKVKSKTEQLFEGIGRKISKKFGNVLSPYINTKTEFKSKHKKNVTVVNNILKEHTLILGERLETII